MSKTGFSLLKKGFSRLPGLSLSNTKAFYSFKSSKWNNLQSDERHPKIKGSLESMLLPAELKRCSWPPGQQHSALVAASLTLGKFALSMLFMLLPHQGPALQWWASDSQSSRSSTTHHSFRPVAADWEYLQCLQYSASTQLNSKSTARHPTPTVGAIFNVGKTQLCSGEVGGQFLAGAFLSTHFLWVMVSVTLIRPWTPVSHISAEPLALLFLVPLDINLRVVYNHWK